MTLLPFVTPRVLHIQKVAGVAGSENHLLALVPALARAGYAPEMMVLASRTDRPEPFVKGMRAAGVPTTVVPLRCDADPLAWAAVTRQMKRQQYDIVHTHLIHGDVYGVTAARMVGVRAVVSTRHNDNDFRKYYAVRLLVRAVTRGCQRVICISDHLGSFVRGAEGVSVDQVRVIRYGLDFGRLPPRGRWRKGLGIPDDAPLLGIVARLIPQKGHSALLEALPRVAERFPAVRIAVVGDGPLRGELERLAERLGIEARVHFVGHRPNAAEMMSEFDVFVHPSRWEGFGLVFLEAMAAGVPVVATRVSAIPEIVEHGRTGLLVPVDDAAALADAVSRLLADREWARAMGQAGRERVLREFTVEAMVRRTCETYDELLANSSARAPVGAR